MRASVTGRTDLGVQYARAAMTAIVAPGGRRRRPHLLTPADLVTLGRGVLVLGCAAVIVRGLVVEGTARTWWVAGLATAAWALDGVDGYVARRTGTVTEHGAVLDSAVDGTLVLVLSVAVAPVAPWALLGGLLYPAYLLGRWWRPRWRRPLPHSRRRRLIGGALCVTLCLGAAPPVPDLAVQVAVGPAVAFVTWSFLVDVRWLERSAPHRRRGAPAGSP